MSWFRVFAPVACMACALSLGTVSGALAAAPASLVVVQPSSPAIHKVAMTDAQKAKAKQCSEEANAKKLHGVERYKFRAECMKKA